MLQETKYYIGGHTAKGFVHFVKSNLLDVNRIFILKHPAKIVKTKVINAWIKKYQGQKMEVFSSPYNKGYIDGVIIQSENIAVLSDEIYQTEVPGAKIIDLTQWIETDEKMKKMVHLDAIISTTYQAAYGYFATGLTYHEKLEEIYFKEMDFNKADSLAKDFIAEAFRGKQVRNREAIIKERLFGTNTSDGIVNHLQELIEPITNRVFIKGRAGTGKSVFMKKVLTACIKYGYDAEIYHCSFDPKSLDMIIIRELDYCLFDSTAPHELFPMRESDQILDLYELTVTRFTDEKYAVDINKWMRKYKQEMKRGISLLKGTQEIHEMQNELWQEVSEEAFVFIINEII